MSFIPKRDIDRADSAYGDQYDQLFPNIEPVESQGPVYDGDLSEDLALKVVSDAIRFYIDAWNQCEEVPSLEDVYELIEFEFQQDYIEEIDDAYKDDPDYQQNEEYRDDMRDVHLEYYYNVVHMEVSDLIRKTLNNLKLCYYELDCVRSIEGQNSFDTVMFNGAQINWLD